MKKEGGFPFLIKLQKQREMPLIFRKTSLQHKQKRQAKTSF